MGTRTYIHSRGPPAIHHKPELKIGIPNKSAAPILHFPNRKIIFLLFEEGYFHAIRKKYIPIQDVKNRDRSHISLTHCNF